MLTIESEKQTNTVRICKIISPVSSAQTIPWMQDMELRQGRLQRLIHGQ